MQKGYSKVYCSDGRELEKERTFQESYFRVIEIANEYIDKGYKIHKMGGTWIEVTNNGKGYIQIGHSNGMNMKGNTYINSI